MTFRQVLTYIALAAIMFFAFYKLGIISISPDKVKWIK